MTLQKQLFKKTSSAPNKYRDWHKSKLNLSGSSIGFADAFSRIYTVISVELIRYLIRTCFVGSHMEVEESELLHLSSLYMYIVQLSEEKEISIKTN